MKKSTTFYERIFRESKSLLEMPKRKKEQALLAGRMQRHLLGERLPGDSLPIRRRSGRQKYIAALFREYYRIKQSLDRIELTKKLISRVPSNISKLDYIRYHYEHYLNEVYIYSSRVNHLLDFIIKKCHKANLSNEATKVEGIRKAFNMSLSNLVKVRGYHVHVSHYENYKLDQLTGLDLLSKDFDFIRHYRDYELSSLRKKINTEIKGTLNILQQFLETDLYKYLSPLIFNRLLKAQTTQVNW